MKGGFDERYQSRYSDSAQYAGFFFLVLLYCMLPLEILQ